jgi:hypothetical protein
VAQLGQALGAALSFFRGMRVNLQAPEVLEIRRTFSDPPPRADGSFSFRLWILSA